MNFTNESTFLNLSQYFNDSPNDLLPSRLGTALGAIIAFVFTIFGLIGDLLIIVAILQKAQLRNNLVNIFIVSLQLNDIFNICFNQILVGLSFTFMKWFGPSIICELFVYTTIICTGSLLWHHALISIHRYLVVVCNQTTSYMGMSPKLYVFISLIIARLIPTLVCAPALINRNMTEYSKAALRCMLAPKTAVLQNLLILVINMAMPVIIIIFCFARIFARVHTVSKNINRSKNDKKLSMTTENSKLTSSTNLNSNCNPMSSRNSMRREIKITKMFAVIFVVFLFGYLPYGIIRTVDKKNDLHPDVYILLTVLFIVSISVSPIIYGLMNSQIRIQCLTILRIIFTIRTKTSIKDVPLKTKKPIRKRCSSMELEDVKPSNFNHMNHFIKFY